MTTTDAECPIGGGVHLKMRFDFDTGTVAWVNRDGTLTLSDCAMEIWMEEFDKKGLPRPSHPDYQMDVGL